VANVSGLSREKAISNHGRLICKFIPFEYAEHSLKFPGTMTWELALVNGRGGEGLSTPAILSTQTTSFREQFKA
jgi:hypothetical protein